METKELELLKEDITEVVKAIVDKNKEETDKDNGIFKGEIETIKSKLDEFADQAEEIRKADTFRQWNDDEIRQGMKKVSGLHIVKSYSKNPKEVEAATTEMESIYKGLHPAVEKKYQFNGDYGVMKSAFMEEHKIEKAAMATTTSGAGAEWLMTVYNLELVKFMNEASPIAGVFKVTTAPTGKYQRFKKTGLAGMPTYPWTIAGAANIAENTANPTVGDVDTGNVTFTTWAINVYHESSHKLNTESAINIVSAIEEDMAIQVLQMRDNAIANGATTSSDVYVGASVHASSVVNKCDGLRQVGLGGVAKTAAAAVFDFDDFRAIRKLMGIYGDNPDELVAFFERGAFYGALDALKTYNNVGAAANIVTGQINTLDGVPVKMGGYAMSAAKTTTAGLFDTTTPANNTEGSALIVFPKSFEIVQDGGINYLQDVDITTWKLRFAGKYEMDFKQIDTSPSASSPVGYLYDITVT